MMSEYDITGNFYWAADLYQQYVGNGAYQPIDDYYGTAERYENANGDGYLMYPGAPYGMDEPLSSLRLETIRDGLEEYELWYALHDAYEAKGYSYEDIQRKVSSLIYQGAKVVSTPERMQLAREAVIRLLELAESPLSVGITDVEESGASVTYTVRAAAGSTLTVPENAGITFTGGKRHMEGDGKHGGGGTALLHRHERLGVGELHPFGGEDRPLRRRGALGEHRAGRRELVKAVVDGQRLRGGRKRLKARYRRRDERQSVCHAERRRGCGDRRGHEGSCPEHL